MKIESCFGWKLYLVIGIRVNLVGSNWFKLRIIVLHHVVCFIFYSCSWILDKIIKRKPCSSCGFHFCSYSLLYVLQYMHVQVQSCGHWPCVTIPFFFSSKNSAKIKDTNQTKMLCPHLCLYSLPSIPWTALEDTFYRAISLYFSLKYIMLIELVSVWSSCGPKWYGPCAHFFGGKEPTLDTKVVPLI